MHRIVSKKRANSLGTALFLLGLAIVSFTDTWWPGILLAVGLPLAFRQFLVGKVYPACLTLFIFCGVFFAYTYGFVIHSDYILPIIFMTGAVFIVVREYFDKTDEDEVDVEEDINHEIEEDAEDNE